MNIVTRRTSNASGTSQVVARGIGGKQKTTNWNPAKSTDWNHGTAAANLILHVSKGMHPLTQQNGDHLPTAVVRSLDAGYGTHDSSDDGQRHTFEV